MEEFHMTSKPWHRFYDYNVPTTIRYPSFPVQNLIHFAAVQFPGKPAVNFLGTEITFWQIREQMLRLANALGGLGLKKGDRVGILLPNCPQYLIAYGAVLSLGCIIVNMNPLYTNDELKFMIENTGLETIVTTDEVLAAKRPMIKEIDLRRVIVTGLRDYVSGARASTAKSLDLEEGWRHFSELIEGCADKRIPRVPFSPQDPALIQFTGGTTGVPKGALLTHANVIAATFQTGQWGNASDNQPPDKRTVLAVLPYFHIYGNIVCMNRAFFTFSTQILMPHYKLDELLETITRFEQITFFPTVPTMLTAIVNHPGIEGMKLGQIIKFANSGGAPIPPELILRVKDLGILLGEGYGMSESTALGIVNPHLSPKVGSIGVPIMDMDVRLVDIEKGDRDVKQGEPGEIVMKGPNIMKEYWKNPEETGNQLKDGWLFTGDIGRADEDGYIYIVDRKKDMIIAGGFNIYPREVDEVLFLHPKIAEAVSAGVPDEYRGETVKAYVVLKPGESATEKEIIEFCRTKLAPYKVPKIVEFRKELPKSAVGKILRKILRDEEIQKKK
jgi:long-chain acyl-CoA synthetase